MHVNTRFPQQHTPCVSEGLNPQHAQYFKNIRRPAHMVRHAVQSTCSTVFMLVFKGDSARATV